MKESNPLWMPIETVERDPAAERVRCAVRRYQVAPAVRLGRSQRYSLVVTEPLPEAVWSRP